MVKNEAAHQSSQIRSIQALRAIAALFVVGFHSTVLWHDRFDGTVRPWDNGNSGVDLFFVISGFIMVRSSRRLVTLPDGWRRFISLRLVRVVPMYWLATLAKASAITAVPAMAQHTHPTPWNIIASFLFIPSHDALGVVRPVLVVGWTLSFEMMFYLIFAVGMLFAINEELLIGSTMGALALASFATGDHSTAISILADPIVLEFAFGVFAARLMGAKLAWAPPVFWLSMIIVGLFILAAVPVEGPWTRAAIWGGAATAVLCGSVRSESWAGRFVPSFAVLIGEASYSLYLTHDFVLPVIGLSFSKLALDGKAFGIVLVASCLILSTVVALLAYRFVEMPMTVWLRSVMSRGRRQPAMTG